MSLESITESARPGGIAITMMSAGNTAKGLASKGPAGQKSAQALSATSKTTKVGHGILSEVSTSTAGEYLCPGAAIFALASNVVTLGVRSGKSREIQKEIDKLPTESRMVWKRKILEARSEHADSLVKSSVAAITADTLSVAGTFIPVIGIPATVVGSAVSLIRMYAESTLNSELIDKLDKITDDYRSSHPTTIQHHEAFEELHETLKSHFEQVVLDKGSSEKTFLEATKDYEKVLGTPAAAEAHRKLSEAGTALNSAEVAVQDVSKHLEDYEMCKENFDSYAQALQLIRDLEPKETPAEERDLDVTRSSLLSTFGGSESIEFASPSAFPAEHVSQSFTKAEKRLREIGITPENSQEPQKKVEPAPKKEESVQEPIDPIEFSKFATTGGLNYF